jgi:protein-tyrosine phosphatase
VNPTARILVVCTANQCRSPLSAAILTARLVEDGAPVDVTSAGTDAGNAPATRGTVDAARRLGIDLTAHTSMPLDASLVRDADLIVTMERRHVQEVALAEPTGFSKAFTLKELVRRGTAAGPRRADESIASWIVRVGAGRRPADLLGRSPVDDVADPTVDRMVDHDTLAAELSDLADRLVALVWPA